eukprot:m51a1_g4421 putative ras-related gtp-binding protein (2116) ;mRNA; r:17591-32413
MHTRQTFSILFCALLSVATAADAAWCTNDSSVRPGSDQQAVMIIGQSAPFTGEHAQIGIDVRAGLEAALALANETSALKFVLAALDDAYDDARQQQNVRTLLCSGAGGLGVRAGLEAALALANETSALKFVLAALDDAYDDARQLQNVRTLLCSGAGGLGPAFAIAGTVGSSESEADLAALEISLGSDGAPVPFVGALTSSQTLRTRSQVKQNTTGADRRTGIVLTRPGGGDELSAIVSLLASSNWGMLNHTSIFFQTTSFASVAVEYLKTMLVSYGATLLSQYGCPIVTSASDLSAMASKAVTALCEHGDPQAVVLVASGSMSGAVLEEMARQQKKNVLYVAMGWVTADELYSAVPSSTWDFQSAMIKYQPHRNISHASLEGFIAGRLIAVVATRALELYGWPLTRAHFLDTVFRDLRTFSLHGYTLGPYGDGIGSSDSTQTSEDFCNQGAHEVFMTQMDTSNGKLSTVSSFSFKFTGCTASGWNSTSRRAVIGFETSKPSGYFSDIQLGLSSGISAHNSDSQRLMALTSSLTTNFDQDLAVLKNRQAIAITGLNVNDTGRALKLVDAGKFLPYIAPLSGLQSLRSPFRRGVINLFSSYYQEARTAGQFLIEKENAKKLIVMWNQDTHNELWGNVTVDIEDHPFRSVDNNTNDEIASTVESALPGDAFIYISTVGHAWELIQRAQRACPTCPALTTSVITYTEMFWKLFISGGVWKHVYRTSITPTLSTLSSSNALRQDFESWVSYINQVQIPFEGFLVGKFLSVVLQSMNEDSKYTAATEVTSQMLLDTIYAKKYFKIDNVLTVGPFLDQDSGERLCNQGMDTVYVEQWSSFFFQAVPYSVNEVQRCGKEFDPPKVPATDNTQRTVILSTTIPGFAVVCSVLVAAIVIRNSGRSTLKKIKRSELEIGERIGKSQFGTVHNGDWHGTPVAIRVVDKMTTTKEDLESIKAEMALTNSVHHPNLMMMLGYSESNKDLLIVSEYMASGSLHEYLKKNKQNMNYYNQVAIAFAAGAFEMPADLSMSSPQTPRNILSEMSVSVDGRDVSDDEMMASVLPQDLVNAGLGLGATGSGRAYRNLAGALDQLGDHARALDCYIKDFEISRETEDRIAEDIAAANLGRALSAQGAFQDSIPYIERHLELSREMRDRPGETEASFALGMSLWKLGQVQKAIGFLPPEGLEAKSTLPEDLGEQPPPSPEAPSVVCYSLRTGPGPAAPGPATSQSLPRSTASLARRPSASTRQRALRPGELRAAAANAEKQLAVAKRCKDKWAQGRAIRHLGWAYDRLGERKRAIDYYQCYLEICQELGDRAGEAAALSDLGNAHECIEEFQAAVELHSRALEIARELNDVQGQGRAYCNMGNAYDRLGEHQLAVEFHLQDLEVAMKLGDKHNMGAAYGNLGVAYEGLGDTKSSAECHEKSLALAKETNDMAEQGRAYRNLAGALDQLGDHARALDCYIKDFEISRETEDRIAEDIAAANLGRALSAQGAFQDSIPYIERHLELSREMRDRPGETEASFALGMSLWKLGQVQKAIGYWEVCLDNARDAACKEDECRAYSHLGDAYSDLGDWKQAVELHTKFLGLAKMLEDKESEATALESLGKDHTLSGDHRRAIEYFDKQSALCQEEDDKGGESEACYSLGNCYISLGVYRQAVQYLQRSLTLAKEVDKPDVAAKAYSGLGIAYSNMGDNKMALELHAKATDISRVLGDKLCEAAECCRRCVCCVRLGSKKQATEHFKSSLFALTAELEDDTRREEIMTSVPLGRCAIAAMRNLIQAHELLANDLGDEEMLLTVQFKEMVDALVALLLRQGHHTMKEKKVLLMGRGGSGKTSMRSIIFANYLARDTTRLAYTINVEHSHVRFLGNLTLNLWDCGGQDQYMDTYFNSQKDQIFRNVELLIYLFDIESHEHSKDIRYYRFCLEALYQNSKDAKVFCLIHKMDVVPEDQREVVFRQKESELKLVSQPLKITCFGTSIWDETLYRAWSNIVYSLVPNIKTLERQLDKFCAGCDADEVVVFECATFLEISHATRKEHPDVHRFEKVSSLIKQFKLSCSKATMQFNSMQVQTPNFAAFVQSFTATTYIMVIVSDPLIQPAATLANIEAARAHFEKISSPENY